MLAACVRGVMVYVILSLLLTRLWSVRAIERALGTVGKWMVSSGM